MSDHQITCGDIVQVDFNNSQQTLFTEAVVVCAPNAVGDSWVFKSRDKVFYVSEPCTITKKLKPDSK